MKFPFKSTTQPMRLVHVSVYYVFMWEMEAKRAKEEKKEEAKRSYQIWIDKSSNNFSIWLESCLFNPFDGFAVSFRSICKRRFHVNRNIHLPVRWIGFHNISNSVEGERSESERERARDIAAVERTSKCELVFFFSYRWRETLTKSRYPIKQDDIDIKATECGRHVHTHLGLLTFFSSQTMPLLLKFLITQISIERANSIKIDPPTHELTTLIKIQHRLSLFFYHRTK